MGRALLLRIGRALIAGVVGASSLVACSFNVEQSASALQSHAILASDRIEPAETYRLAGLQEHFEKIARQVSPAVVAISASSTPFHTDDVLRSEDMNAEKLASLLDRTTRIVGTGFFIDADGYLLTNEHVVGEAQQIWVTTDDHRIYPAVVVGSDPRADLAVLKIPAGDMPVVRFASEPARRGQWTIALGNPYGLAMEGEMCMSIGVVSATDRSLPKLASKENRHYMNLIQTTAEINPGNSGGPLLNLAGEVIGINTAVILPQKQVNGIGFALPVSQRLMSTVTQLKGGSEVLYGYLGVTLSTPTERERRQAGIARSLGARIDSVEAGTPAADAGLRPGDIVVRFSDHEVGGANDLVNLISCSPVEEPLALQLYRDGSASQLTVSLKGRELPQVAMNRQRQRLHWRGLVIGPVPSHWELNKAAGQVVGGLMVFSVDPSSPMAQAGIVQGSIIREVAGKPVSTVADLLRIVNETPGEACKVASITPDKVASARN